MRKQNTQKSSTKTLSCSLFFHHHHVVVVVIILIVNAAAAFEPPPLSHELGGSPTLTVLVTGRWNINQNNNNQHRNRNNNDEYVYFDPLGIAQDSNFARLREAELKHGRIAMLAVTDLLVRPLLLSSSLWKDPMNDPPNLYDAANRQSLDETTMLLMMSIVVTAGFFEVFVGRPRDPVHDMPGDYGWGYFGVRDKAAHEWELRSELEHGRLAMLGMGVHVLLLLLLTMTNPFDEMMILPSTDDGPWLSGGMPTWGSNFPEFSMVSPLL